VNIRVRDSERPCLSAGRARDHPVMETRIVPNKALSLSLSHTHSLSGVTSRSYGRDRRVVTRAVTVTVTTVFVHRGAFEDSSTHRALPPW